MSNLNIILVKLVAFLVFFTMLFMIDHFKQDAYKPRSVQRVEAPIEHKKLFAERRSRLQAVCRQIQQIMRVEHSSVFKRKKLVNSCTGTYFQIQEKVHFICNVLKGGSSSWKAFFGENKIPILILGACEDNEMFIGNCPSHTKFKLVQVRHPLVRLLATYRHVFKNGWKSLQGKNKLDQDDVDLFSKDWVYFVDEVVLKDKFHKTEKDLEHYDASGVWIKHHWAPYWYTCGLCSPGNTPDIIVKTETLEQDIPPVLDMLNMPRNTSFPHIRVIGRNASENDTRASEEVVENYSSQLTKQQVMRLYEMYKLDHIMFDYSPQKYIDMAR